MKIKLFLFIILITPLICGLFGILHDQVTYSIAPEYFTKFKFIQFRLVDENMQMHMSNRAGAVIVGFMATWWVGIPIGITYAAFLMTFKEKLNLYRFYWKAIGITLNVTILFSLIGYIQGIVEVKNHHIPNWYFPEGLINIDRFIIVGNIHNLSYMGGTVGLMAGTLFLAIKKSKEKKIRREINFSKTKNSEN